MEDHYCQKCRQPLIVDPSLGTLNPASFDLLVGPSSPGFVLPKANRTLQHRLASRNWAI